MRVQRALESLRRQPRWRVLAVCIASLGAVGVADYFTPDDLALSLIYLLPVAIATWCRSRSFGLGFAVVGAVTYMASEAFEAGGPSAPMLFFNTVVEGSVFVVVVLLLSGLKTHLDGERQALIVAEEALANVRQLSALLPMCSSCKKIRHEPEGSWEPFEIYLRKHSDTQVSHGICPDCMARLYPEQFRKLQKGPATA